MKKLEYAELRLSSLTPAAEAAVKLCRVDETLRLIDEAVKFADVASMYPLELR